MYSHFCILISVSLSLHLKENLNISLYVLLQCVHEPPSPLRLKHQSPLRTASDKELSHPEAEGRLGKIRSKDKGQTVIRAVAPCPLVDEWNVIFAARSKHCSSVISVADRPHTDVQTQTRWRRGRYNNKRRRRQVAGCTLSLFSFLSQCQFNQTLH